MSGWSRIALLAACLCLATASPVVACSIILPAPGPGETMRIVADRFERRQQQTLRASSDIVYLARVRADPGRVDLFHPVAAILGDRPSRRVPTLSREEGCEPTTPAPGELRIVFATRIAPTDRPWRPWRWGEITVLASRRPDQVRDPALVDLMQRAARSISIG